MSNFNTVTPTNESEGSDLYLLGRGNTSRTQTRDQLFSALKSEALKIDAGKIVPIVSTIVASHLVKADGQILSRTTDNYLWDFAQNSGLLVSQSTKDGNPVANAMKWGDGDGSTTFSIPNLHLGEFLRGAPAGVDIGDVQGDAIRNITGAINLRFNGNAANPSGAFDVGPLSNVERLSIDTGNLHPYDVYSLDASRVVPTADENRPKTGNILMCIHRGKV